MDLDFSPLLFSDDASQLFTVASVGGSTSADLGVVPRVRQHTRPKPVEELDTNAGELRSNVEVIDSLCDADFSKGVAATAMAYVMRLDARTQTLLTDASTLAATVEIGTAEVTGRLGGLEDKTEELAVAIKATSTAQSGSGAVIGQLVAANNSSVEAIQTLRTQLAEAASSSLDAVDTLKATQKVALDGLVSRVTFLETTAFQLQDAILSVSQQLHTWTRSTQGIKRLRDEGEESDDDPKEKRRRIDGGTSLAAVAHTATTSRASGSSVNPVLFSSDVDIGPLVWGADLTSHVRALVAMVCPKENLPQVMQVQPARSYNHVFARFRSNVDAIRFVNDWGTKSPPSYHKVNATHDLGIGRSE